MKKLMIDCVKMKRDAQEQIYKEIKGLSAEEQLEYFRKAVDGKSSLAAKFRRLQGPSSDTEELARKARGE